MYRLEARRTSYITPIAATYAFVCVCSLSLPHPHLLRLLPPPSSLRPSSPCPMTSPPPPPPIPSIPSMQDPATLAMMTEIEQNNAATKLQGLMRQKDAKAKVLTKGGIRRNREGGLVSSTYNMDYLWSLFLVFCIHFLSFHIVCKPCHCCTCAQVSFMRDKQKESDDNAAILKQQEKEAAADAEAAASLQQAASGGGSTPLRGKAKKDEAKRTFDAALEKHRQDAQAKSTGDGSSGSSDGPLLLEAKLDYCTGKGPFGGDVFQAR